MIEGSNTENLIADIGYNRAAIIEQARTQGIKVQIPPRGHRKHPRDCDLYF